MVRPSEARRFGMYLSPASTLIVAFVLVRKPILDFLGVGPVPVNAQSETPNSKVFFGEYFVFAMFDFGESRCVFETDRRYGTFVAYGCETCLSKV